MSSGPLGVFRSRILNLKYDILYMPGVALCTGKAPWSGGNSSHFSVALPLRGRSLRVRSSR
jgi:hypothetical protein